MHKKRGKKAQYSIELLSVAAIALFLIVPIMFLFYSYSQSSIQQVTNDIMSMIGNEIINTCELVYYFGEPSKVTFVIGMPDGIQNVTVRSNGDDYNELIFQKYGNELGGGEEFVFFSDVFINGTFGPEATTPGKKTITCRAQVDSFSKKRFVNLSIA